MLQYLMYVLVRRLTIGISIVPILADVSSDESRSDSTRCMAANGPIFHNHT